MKLFNLNLKKPENSNIKIYDKLFFIFCLIFFFLFFSHPDIWETANHSYLFLENLFSGNFLNYYEFVAAHNNSYYYINNANYNIFVYILFGIWQLPVFIFNKLFAFSLNESFIIYWSKLLSISFYIGCGYFARKISLSLKLSEKTSFFVGLFFIFSPVAFFGPMIMGQYDSLCLFFTLWGIYHYVNKRYYKFCFISGIGIVCKIFPIMIIIPLLLLTEKKILNLCKYAISVLWLYIPTTILFWNKASGAANFNKEMLNRLFNLTFKTGFNEVSIFVVCYAIILFCCYIYTPRNTLIKNYITIYIPMVIFALLFSTILWHPQWVILVTPFIIITTFMQKNKTPWLYLDIIFAVGFILTCFQEFPSQVGAVLLDGGIFSHISGARVSLSPDWVFVKHFLSLVPFIQLLTPVMLIGSLFSNIILKFPLGEETIGDRLSKNSEYDNINIKTFLYGIFIIGFILVWFLPTIFEALNAFKIL